MLIKKNYNQKNKENKPHGTTLSQEDRPTQIVTVMLTE
jgi:hypothetical protein